MLEGVVAFMEWLGPSGVLALAVILIVFFALIGAARRSESVQNTTEAEDSDVAVWSRIPRVSGIIVMERYGDLVRPTRAKLDGKTLVTETKHTYVIPSDYRPLIMLRKYMFRQRAFLVFLADAKKPSLIKWENGKVDDSELDPELLYNIMNTRILEKLAGAVHFKLSDFATGLLGGLGVAFILVLFVFPLLGIPVNIGENPVHVTPEVKVEVPPPNQLPPPAQYTINATGPQPGLQPLPGSPGGGGG